MAQPERVADLVKGNLLQSGRRTLVGVTAVASKGQGKLTRILHPHDLVGNKAPSSVPTQVCLADYRGRQGVEYAEPDADVGGFARDRTIRNLCEIQRSDGGPLLQRPLNSTLEFGGNWSAERIGVIHCIGGDPETPGDVET